MMRKSKLLFLVLMSMMSLHVFAQTKKPVVIEVVYSGGAAEREKLIGFCGSQQFIDANDIYEWKNHFVIFGGGYKRFYSKIKATFKDCIVKEYDKPFYNFQRSKFSNKKTDKRFNNILLTANLVKDPKLQQEYLNYHKTQFEKWPEVSQGFCNASFQQLLVFKNGRQLMLIISIPIGKTLDELNPLTTKNNPKVDEWNKIMAKYQEGIEGTAKGETWVFLKAYNQTDHINN